MLVTVCLVGAAMARGSCGVLIGGNGEDSGRLFGEVLMGPLAGLIEGFGW